ncbi:MAG: ABC transporter ATP-binding protein [Negativicutes bacterium]|jgi:ABC-2 type transport system ATP-binding protein
MLTINNLRFGYGTKRKLFEGLNLELVPGNIYGLLGKNGAGKTTLLKIISGVLFAQGGDCKLFGRRAELREWQMLSEVYFLPEEPAAPVNSGKEYIKIYASFYPRFSITKFTKIIEEWKINVDQSIATLSQGERKKFFIAFALATNCKLILMDEPSNGLDIPAKTVFRKLIAGAVDENSALVISSHQVRDLDGLIDPIIIIDSGKIVLNESIANIEDKIMFSLGAVEPDTERLLYSMQVPAGWSFAVVKTNVDDYGSKADLELLFNATVENPARMQQLFGRDVK